MQIRKLPTTFDMFLRAPLTHLDRRLPFIRKFPWNYRCSNTNSPDLPTGLLPRTELIYIHLASWQEYAKIARFANMTTTMYWTNLHTFCDLTRIRGNRHISKIRQHGWSPCIELFYVHLAIWENFATIAIFAKMVKLLVVCYFANFVIVCISGHKCKESMFDLT